MIKVTRLDRSEFWVNAELVQTVESTPDTHIVLVNGASYVVREPGDEVVEQILAYRRAAYAGVAPDEKPHLRLIEGQGR